MGPNLCKDASGFLYNSGHALGIWICGCSLFYKRQLRASKSEGFNSTNSLKIFRCKSLFKVNRLHEAYRPCLKYWFYILWALGMLPVIPTFPIILLSIKFISIFNHGSEWKKINDVVSMFEGQVEAYLQVGLQCYIIIQRPDRAPSSIQITALCTSCLMILVGQANAWYANNPETSLIEDIKRKIAIAVLLVIPNVTVIGGALILITSLFAPFFFILIIFLAVVLMLIYSICYCCKRRRGRNPMCCRFTTYCKSVLVLMYFLLLTGFIYDFIGLYYSQFNNRNLVLKGVVLGVGFLPTTMFLVYYLYSTSCACCRRENSIVMEQ